MIPPDPIPPDQAWFWTPEWQAGEREAEQDFLCGRYTTYATMEEFIAALHDDSEGGE